MSFCGDDTFWIDASRTAVQTLKEHKAEYDMVVCQGLSGQAIGFRAAYELGVPLLILRKTAGEEHSKRQGSAKTQPGLLEGTYLIRLFKRDKGKAPRVCFVDDCLGGGNTRRRCGAAVFQAGGVVTCQVSGGAFGKLSKIQQKSFEKASATAIRSFNG